MTQTKGTKGRPTSSCRKAVVAPTSADAFVASGPGRASASSADVFVASGPSQASGGAASSSGAPPAPLADVRAAPERRQPRRRGYVPAIGGGFCYYEAYDGGSSGRPCENWSMLCSRHENCHKRRSLARFLPSGMVSWSRWRFCTHGGIWSFRQASRTVIALRQNSRSTARWPSTSWPSPS